MTLKIKNITKLICALFICFLSSCKEAPKKIGEAGFEKITKVGTKIWVNTFEDASESLSKEFGEEFVSHLSKNNDDNFIKRLAKDINDNQELVRFFKEKKNNVLVWKQFGESSIRKNTPVLRYFSSLIDNMGEKAFKENYKIIPTSESILLKDAKSNKLLAEISDNVLYAKSGTGTEVNKFLNEKKLIPNYTYNVDGHKYIVNKLGQFKSVDGTLKPPFRDISILSESQKHLALTNNNAIQNQLLNDDFLKPVFNDDAVTLIPSILDGGRELINLVPISKKHLGKNGDWTKMMNEWSQAIKNNQKVSYKIDFQSTSQLKRPDYLDVTYEINGKRIFKSFDNNITLLTDLKLSKNLDLIKVIGKNNLNEIGTILKSDLIKRYEDGIPIYNENLIKFLKSDPQAGEAYTKLARFGTDIRVNDGHLKQTLLYLKNNNGEKLVLDDVSRTPKWLTKEMKTHDVIKSPTGITYVKQTIEKGDIILNGHFPEFNLVSLNTTKIPEAILKKGREEHFSFYRQSLKNQYEANTHNFLTMLKKQNKVVLKRDLALYNKNKNEILNLDTKRLDGTISKIEKARYDEITKDITFKNNGKGVAFRMYDVEQILEKQIKDITNPSSGTKNRVFGYVMHHKEKNGEIMLVQTFQHNKNIHSGGYTLDGGGIE